MVIVLKYYLVLSKRCKLQQSILTAATVVYEKGPAYCKFWFTRSVWILSPSILKKKSLISKLTISSCSLCIKQSSALGLTQWKEMKRVALGARTVSRHWLQKKWDLLYLSDSLPRSNLWVKISRFTDICKFLPHEALQGKCKRGNMNQGSLCHIHHQCSRQLELLFLPMWSDLEGNPRLPLTNSAFLWMYFNEHLPTHTWSWNLSRSDSTQREEVSMVTGVPAHQCHLSSLTLSMYQPSQLIS